MSFSTSVTAFSALVFAAGAVACAQSAAPAHRDPAYGKHAMAFEPNRGQTAAPTQFLARGRNYSVLLAPAQATLVVHQEQGSAAERRKALRTGKSLPTTEQVVRMTLAGANASVQLQGQTALPGYVNYIFGSDRTRDLTGIPTFAATRIHGTYAGVDTVYYGTDKQLEYDFIVAPQADPTQIKLHFAGASPRLGSDGALHLQAGLSFQKPVVYQQQDGRRQPVEGSFAVAKNGEVSFHLGAYDHSRELVIDPILSYASYFGGAGGGAPGGGEDEINASAVNTSNQLYAVGQTFSADLPGTAGEFQSKYVSNISGAHDGFVTKFSADGSALLWTTYLGGTGDDFATGVAVNSADQPVIVGYTNSCGGSAGPGAAPFTPVVFPVTSGAVQNLCAPSAGTDSTGKPVEVNGAGYNAFVSRLSGDGKTLLYSTFLGGSNNTVDTASAVALDAAGTMYVVGRTTSTSYLQPQPGVTNFSPVPGYAITGNGGGTGVGVADFPTTANAYQRAYTYAQTTATCNSSYCSGTAFESSFLSVLSPSGSSLIYSTVLTPPNTGGCGNGDCDTYTNAVAVGPNNIVYVGGNTNSLSLPVTANAFAPACTTRGKDCSRTGFLYAIDISKSGAASLVFSTYVNGTSTGLNPNGVTLSPTSEVDGVTTDSQGNVVLTGYTNANNFPTTTGAFQTTCPQFGDGSGNTKRCNTGLYLLKLTPAGATLWSTLYGPTGTSDGGVVTGGNVRLDAKDNVFASFYGISSSFPLKNAFSTNTGADAHLIELNPTASTLLMGTALGTGGGITLNNSLSLDSNQNAYFSGSQGPNPYGGTYLPVTPNAYQQKLLGNADGFVVKIITQQQPTSATLAVTPSGQLSPTQAATLTATVASTSTLTGIPTSPTGTVSFLNGTTVLGTGTLNASGVATYSGMLPGGSDSLTAVYAGDSGFNGATSAPVVVNVSSAVATTTSLVVSPATASAGQTVTLTSTTLAGTAPATAGTVTFTAGTMTLGTATVGANGVATTTITPAVGTYTVVASFAGTFSGTNPTGTANSVSAGQPLTVGKATPTVAVSASTALAPVGGSVTFTARVSGTTGTPTGTVNFVNGTTVLGSATLNAGVATFTSATLAAGTYSVSANYLGDTSFAAASSTTTAPVVVRTPAATTLSLATSATTAPVKTAITLTATLTTTATGTPTGTVIFLSGTTMLGTGTLTNNIATFTTSVLPVGAQQLTAVYSGDTLFATSTSNALTETVTNPTLSITATPTPLIIQHGHSGVLNLTLTPSGGFAGTVTFGCGGLPQFVTCVFAPTSLVFTAASSAAQTDMLTIFTDQRMTASMLAPKLFSRTNAASLAMLLWLPGSALALFGVGRRKGLRKPIKSLLMLALVVSGLGIAGGLSGCASSNNFNSATPGTYMVPVTITATDGSSQTVNATVTIQ